MRASDRTFQRSQLLSEGDVLEENRLMASPGQHGRSDHDEHEFQHSEDPVAAGLGKSTGAEADHVLANDRGALDVVFAAI
jgi:hypothetical protein